MPKQVAIIGAGISGLSAACFLAKAGLDVTVYEKNSSPGGRARQFVEAGYTYDMGPSWYWMPDVFDRFFQNFDKQSADFYNLIRLDPGYRVFFSRDSYLDVPARIEKLYALFESVESGSSVKLKKFLAEAAIKYRIGISELVYNPSHSILDFADFRILSGLIRMDLLRSISSVVRKSFTDYRLIRLLEFPVLFLGATPQKTPALYSLMNYADLVLGTWYPMGGIYKVVEALVSLAQSIGVKILYNTAVEKIEIGEGIAHSLRFNGSQIAFDYLIGSADYNHIEQQLIEKSYRTYSQLYWDRRIMAPSSLMVYMGINKPLPGLLHHNIFFDTDFEKHAAAIYTTPRWPENPAVYISCTSKTDNSVAPPGHENIVALIPVATGLQDSDEVRGHYFNYIVDKLEYMTGTAIRDYIDYSRIYSHRDFRCDYNAFGGNAYGLANTLLQTAFLKPKMKSRKVKNLFYTGQLTTPGPGVPPTLISGEVVAREVIKTIYNV